MELGVLCAYRDEINKAMKEIGCPDECLLPTEDSDETWVWSSSENSQNYSWYVYFSGGGFGSNNECNSGMVRAVAAVCMGELLANISADGMSIEDAF